MPPAASRSVVSASGAVSHGVVRGVVEPFGSRIRGVRMVSSDRVETVEIARG